MLFHSEEKAHAGCHQIGFGNICIAHGFARGSSRNAATKASDPALKLRSYGAKAPKHVCLRAESN